MEQQSDTPGVSRGQNQLHTGPESAAAGADVVRPLLERIDPELPATQVLVITSDEEAAAALAGRLVASADHRIRVLAATEGRRSTRVLRAAPAHVVLAPAPTIVSLMQAAVIKLDAVRVIVLAWIDEAGADAAAALESVMGEVPKDAPRYILAASASPAVEELVERYARRARRVQGAQTDLPPVSLSYVTTADGARLTALRRTLDMLDPESATVVTPDEQSRDAMQEALRALGYGAGGALVQVRHENEPDDATPRAVTVLIELPASDTRLRQIVAAASPSRVIALVTPRQVTSLHRMAGGTLSPLALPDAAARARSREESLRDELRAVLEANQFSRELVTLEPLLSDFDGAEVAAAALKLLDQQRAKPAASATQAAPGPMTRLYLNAGSMDDLRPGDLIGAITNEAGVARSEIGRVDVRDKHSTVEVSTPIANTVVSKLTGIEMKGRRLIARVDEDRPRERRGGDRPMRSGGGRPGAGRPERGDRRGPPRDRRPGRERPRGDR